MLCVPPLQVLGGCWLRLRRLLRAGWLRWLRMLRVLVPAKVLEVLRAGWLGVVLEDTLGG